MMQRLRRGFTLVEILIVVIILGILAAIVVPNMSQATEDAAEQTAIHELYKLRRAIEVYQSRNDNAFPPVLAGDGTWGPIVAADGAYLRSAPNNPWIGGANAGVIIIRGSADAAYPAARTYGWIYNDATGEVWAAGFDSNDLPLARP